MAGRVEWAADSRAGDRRLVELVRELQGGDALGPVWVGVHSPLVGLHLRREFAAGGPFAGVRFAPLTRLAELIGAPPAAEGGRRPLTEVALRAACRQELAPLRRRPRSWLGPVADHGSTEEALARTWRAARRLDPETLARVSRLGGRAREVAALVTAVSDRLRPHFFDGEELAEVAAQAVVEGAELDAVGPVVVDRPDPLSSRTIGLLEALARRTPVVVLLRPAGDELADRALAAMAARMAERGFEVLEPPSPEAAGREVEVLSVPDDDEEVRTAVRLLAGHAEAGGDLGRCIVTFPHDVSDVRLAERLADQLRRAGLPFSAYGGRSLSASPEGRVLSGLVALACDGEEGPRLDRGAVAAWLRSGPVRADRGLARGLGHLAVLGGDGEGAGAPPVGPGRLAVGRIDRCSRAAGIVGGLEQWRSRLSSYARRPPERWEPGAPGTAAAELAVFVERLAGLLAGARAATTWSELAAWAAAAVPEVLAASDEREALTEAVGELSALDSVEQVADLLARERCERLRDALGLVLARPAGSGGRFGTGPVVASLHAVAGVASELTIVLACREGALPVRVSDDPLLPQVELERAGGTGETDRPDERDRRDLLAVLASSQAVVMTWPRVDLSMGQEVLPSRWLEAPPITARPDSVASFARGLSRVAHGEEAAADLPDFELATLAAAMAHRALAGGLPPHPVLAESRLEERLGAERRRRSPGLSRFAGDLRRAGGRDPETGALFGRVLSPTTLENFSLCPFRHFLDHVLRLAPLDAPEEVVTIDARERGILIHDVLERFFRPDPDTAPAPPPPFDAGELARLRALVEEAFSKVESEGKTGKELFWRIERAKIRRDLERFAAIEAERARATEAVPVAVELSFGRDDEAPLVIRAAGREVAFRGQMDRVDREPDGSIVVIDYKSGGSDAYRDIETDALGRGRHLQLPIYAMAARDRFADPSEHEGARTRLRAEYRFVSSEASFGVAQVELTDTLDAALSELLGILVSTIDRGCFPPNPGPLERFGYAHCGWCDFDALCPNDRGEQWEQARKDAALEAYVNLVAPNGAAS